jgi:hypothetical protein
MLFGIVTTHELLLAINWSLAQVPGGVLPSIKPPWSILKNSNDVLSALVQLPEHLAR